MDSSSERGPVSLPPEVPIIRSRSRRRGILLAGLLVGLVAFFVWLPERARTALWAALSAQRGLVSMLLLFALIALSLVWSVGERVDTWGFRMVNLHGLR